MAKLILEENPVLNLEMEALTTRSRGNPNTWNPAYKQLLENDKTLQQKLETVNGRISNCITKIPQNIKLELTDGVLVLKAGSIVTIPDGKDEDGENKFIYRTIESDLTLSNLQWGDESLVMVSIQGITSLRTDLALSGSNVAYVKDYRIYYNINTNKYYNADPISDEWTENQTQMSLPIALCDGDATNVSSIKQVFNGMGFIGCTVWVDKGVEVLCPCGKNEDGTLRSLKYVTDHLAIRSYSVPNPYGANWFIWKTGELFGYNEWAVFNQTTQPVCYDTNNAWFNAEDNLWYTTTDCGTSWIPHPFGFVKLIEGITDETGSQLTHFKSEPIKVLNEVNINPPGHNFIINGNFHINQRGNEVYSGNVNYTVDRWYKWDKDEGFSVTVNNDKTITLTNTTDHTCRIVQPIEIFEQLRGERMALSCKVKSCDAKSGFVGVYDGYDRATCAFKSGIIESNMCVIDKNAPLMRVHALVFAGKSVTLEWIKLEKGNISTPFVPPDPATELLKCQRYYQIKSLATANYYNYGTDYITFVMNLLTNMRTAGTISLSSNAAIRLNGVTPISGFTLDSYVSYLKSECVITANKTNHGVSVPPDTRLLGSVVIDAEIY